MDNEEKKETFADKAKAQFDALKTQEGRDAIKNKAKEGVEGAKRLWNAASIVQRVVVLVAVVLVTIFLVRSCGSNPPATVASNDTQQGNLKQDEKAAPKVDSSVDLTKAGDKTDSLKSFVGFEFGTSADKFKNVEEVYVVNKNVPYDLRPKEFKSSFEEWNRIPEEKQDELRLTKHHVKFYEAVADLKNKFRLFDFAVLKFTGKDKRLYKITIQTKAEALVGYKPTSILREAQYCAAMIERKYGSRFSTHNSSLYEKNTEKDSYRNGYEKWSATARILGSVEYATYFDGGDKLHNNEKSHGVDSGYAIAPGAYYHGFFNNTIEIDVSCGSIGGKYLGITISAMDHGIIEEEGGRTKVIPLDADDDEGNL